MTRTTFAIFFVLFSFVFLAACQQAECPPCECQVSEKRAPNLEKSKQEMEEISKNINGDFDKINKTINEINRTLEDDHKISEQVERGLYNNCKIHYEFAFKNEDHERAEYWKTRWNDSWKELCKNHYPPPSKSGPPSR